MNDRDYQNGLDFIDTQPEALGDKASACANDELKTILSTWTLHAPASLRQRVLNSYRMDFRNVPLWRRLLTASVSVPAPIAFAALLLLVLGGVVFVRRPSVVVERTPVVVERIQTVEVPVTKREVESHAVYRDRGRARPAPARTRLNAAKEKNMTLAMVDQENRQGFFTGTDLTGFYLNDAMSLKVIKRAERNEK